MDLRAGQPMVLPLQISCIDLTVSFDEPETSGVSDWAGGKGVNDPRSGNEPLKPSPDR